MAAGEADKHADRKSVSFCWQSVMQIRNNSTTVILIHTSSSLYHCGVAMKLFFMRENRLLFALLSLISCIKIRLLKVSQMCTRYPHKGTRNHRSCITYTDN